MQRHDPDASFGAAPQEIACDLCVIGAGAGGLAAASMAAALGQSVTLVEKHKLGGDSLNYGAVPSQALIAAASRADAVRTAGLFIGGAGGEPAVDREAVLAGIRRAIGELAPASSIERLRGLGMRVVQGPAKFIDRETVTAGGNRIRARRYLIATGSSPLVPSLAGLAEVPHFTSESLLSHAGPVSHLIVIGAGATGLELGQAYQRLGSRVTIIEQARALGNADPEQRTVLLESLRGDGIEIREGAKVERVAGRDGDVQATVVTDGATDTVAGSHLLVAAGRKAGVGDLGLEQAGISVSPQGIIVDRGLRTTNRRVFAVGDCIGGLQSTHLARHQATIAIKRALLGMPARFDAALVPQVVYTAPELASVGISEAEAGERKRGYRVLRWPYAGIDRASIDRCPRGHLKVIVDKRGVVVGASIVGAQAGELINVWSLAVAQRLNIKAMTEYVAPYPSLGELNQRAALRSLTALGSNPLIRKMIGLMKRFG